MREIERVHERLTDVRIDVTRQTSKPCFDGIQAFADTGETKTVDDPLDGAHLFLDAQPVGIHNAYGRREITKGYMIAPKRLQCGVGIDHFVVGVGIEELYRLVVHHLA